MFAPLETGLGLDIILWLQQFRSGFVDTILYMLNFAGGELFYIALLAAVYWLFNKRLGIRMLFALILISILNSIFKDLLARPRPYEMSDAFTPLVIEHSYGIPSGHVAYATMVWGYLAVSLRKRWLTIGAIIYITLQFFGRMIAGVHYPEDVVAGLILASITLVLYVSYVEKVVDFWKKQSLSIQIAIPVALTIMGLILISVIPLQQNQIDAYGTLLGLLWGAGLAAAIEARYIRFQVHDSRLIQVIQYVIGIGLAVVLLKGMGIAFDVISQTGVLGSFLRIIRYGLLAFFALAIWPYLSIRFNLMEADIKENTSTA